MAVGSYETVRFCAECAKNRVRLRKNTANLKLFSSRVPLELVAIDIFGPLLTTQRGNKFVLVINELFSKLVQTVPLKRITALTVASAFVMQWVLAYGLPVKLLSDNGRQFTSKLFNDV